MRKKTTVVLIEPKESTVDKLFDIVVDIAMGAAIVFLIAGIFLQCFYG